MEYTFGKLFPEHFRVSSLQICMIVLGKMHYFDIVDVVKWNCPMHFKQVQLRYILYERKKKLGLGAL